MKLLVLAALVVAVTAAVLPEAEYLPPVEESAEVVLKDAEAPLAEDGYRYKTVRRLKYRHRRDVSELVAPEYLPPAEEVAELKEAEVTEAPEESAALAEDGYRYKTVRRLKYRHRRDLSTEYLAPIDDNALPSAEYLPPSETVLADDGYRYRTLRKLRLRHRRRREAPELPVEEYLPPVEDVDQSVEEVPEDGYRYRTVKRLKYKKYRLRKRREAETNEYLPPAEEEPVEEAEPETKLAEDGYRYKTIRRLKYKH